MSDTMETEKDVESANLEKDVEIIGTRVYTEIAGAIHHVFKIFFKCELSEEEISDLLESLLEKNTEILHSKLTQLASESDDKNHILSIDHIFPNENTDAKSGFFYKTQSRAQQAQSMLFCLIRLQELFKVGRVFSFNEFKELCKQVAEINQSKPKQSLGLMGLLGSNGTNDDA